MTIYAADIMDLAKPIATKEDVKPKKERKRKAEKEVPSTPPNKVEHDETNPPPAPVYFLTLYPTPLDTVDGS